MGSWSSTSKGRLGCGAAKTEYLPDPANLHDWQIHPLSRRTRLDVGMDPPGEWVAPEAF
jgi:hypothetical protein